jgi:alpha-tubulin suppressor-like RCC1 family protein
MKMALQFALVLLLWPVLALQAATTVTHIAAGGDHSLFIKSDGSLWAMGDNEYGQLGDGIDSFGNFTNQPVEIVSSGVVAVAAGEEHSLFLKSDGSLWGMGANYSGELGDGTIENFKNQPVEITSNGIVGTAAGWAHSLFIKSDGSLWGMGYNGDGELGDGTYGTPPYSSTASPEQIVSNSVVAVAAGNDFSLFIKSDGSLWGMGNNSYGQLGDGTFNSTNKPERIVSGGVVAIAAAADYSLFVQSDGSLWGMGTNGSGQLGDGTTNDMDAPEEIVSNDVVAVVARSDFGLFIKSDGSLWGMGARYSNRPEEIASNGVVAVAAGGGDSLFIKSDGSLWGMGDNRLGQLGDGFVDNSSVLLPEQIVPQPLPVLEANFAASAVTNIAAGNDFSLMIESDGSLWAMGDNSSGQLGDGTYDSTCSPQQIVSGNVVAATTGAYAYLGREENFISIHSSLHSLFLKSDGSLWGMGDNAAGELGDGTNVDVTTPIEIISNGVVAVAAGGGDSLFIKSDGSLWGMGLNSFGDLGAAGGSIPQEIVSNGVVAVAGGGSDVLTDGPFGREAAFSLFVKSDGSLWGMGYNGEGELGDGTTNNVTMPEEIVSNNVVAVAAGRMYYSLFVKTDGSLWSMGGNYSGTTPEEIVSNGVAAVAAGAGFSLFIKSDGSLWGMGQNNYGQLGDGTLNFTNQPEEIVSNGVVAIAAGYNHTLFLKSDGSVWSMGDNSDGELGNGSGSSLVPEKVAGGLWLRGTCFAGGTHRLLSSTNAALPLSQWTPVWTNTVVQRGPNNFSAPLPDDLLSRDPQRFYTLQAR